MLQLAGGPNLPFYKMTMVLEQLCDDVTLTQKLLSHKKIKAHRKKETSTKNSILFTLWSRYQATEVFTAIYKLYKNLNLIKHCPYFQLSTNQLLEEIVLELRSSFPSVVSDHPMNINDGNIDAYDMSLDDSADF